MPKAGGEKPGVAEGLAKKFFFGVPYNLFLTRGEQDLRESVRVREALARIVDGGQATGSDRSEALVVRPDMNIDIDLSRVEGDIGDISDQVSALGGIALAQLQMSERMGGALASIEQQLFLQQDVMHSILGGIQSVAEVIRHSDQVSIELARNQTALRADEEFRIANRMLEVGRFDVALEHLDRSVDKDPSDYRPYFQRGLCRVYQNDYKGAKADFILSMDLLNVEPHSQSESAAKLRSTLCMYLAQLDYSVGLSSEEEDYQKDGRKSAISYSKDAIEENERNFEAKFALAWYLASDGQNGKSVDVLRNLALENPMMTKGYGVFDYFDKVFGKLGNLMAEEFEDGSNDTCARVAFANFRDALAAGAKKKGFGYFEKGLLLDAKTINGTEFWDMDELQEVMAEFERILPDLLGQVCDRSSDFEDAYAGAGIASHFEKLRKYVLKVMTSGFNARFRDYEIAEAPGLLLEDSHLDRFNFDEVCGKEVWGNIVLNHLRGLLEAWGEIVKEGLEDDKRSELSLYSTHRRLDNDLDMVLLQWRNKGKKERIGAMIEVAERYHEDPSASGLVLDLVSFDSFVPVYLTSNGRFDSLKNLNWAETAYKKVAKTNPAKLFRVFDKFKDKEWAKDVMMLMVSSWSNGLVKNYSTYSGEEWSQEVLLAAVFKAKPAILIEFVKSEDFHGVSDELQISILGRIFEKDPVEVLFLIERYIEASWGSDMVLLAAEQVEPGKLDGFLWEYGKDYISCEWMEVLMDVVLRRNEELVVGAYELYKDEAWAEALCVRFVENVPDLFMRNLSVFVDAKWCRGAAKVGLGRVASFGASGVEIDLLYKIYGIDFVREELAACLAKPDSGLFFKKIAEGASDDFVSLYPEVCDMPWAEGVMEEAVCGREDSARAFELVGQHKDKEWSFLAGIRLLKKSREFGFGFLKSTNDVEWLSRFFVMFLKDEELKEYSEHIEYFYGIEECKEVLRNLARSNDTCGVVEATLKYCPDEDFMRSLMGRVGDRKKRGGTVMKKRWGIETIKRFSDFKSLFVALLGSGRSQEESEARALDYMVQQRKDAQFLEDIVPVILKTKPEFVMDAYGVYNEQDWAKPLLEKAQTVLKGKDETYEWTPPHPVVAWGARVRNWFRGRFPKAF
ncbi:hypothetical protein HOF67_01960 [Candidatus Peregrinibacteria bacterium]|jgi:tetratricopeptide (TPR) repeat protein|nr:hypothetical protein [Candidatus Peregrinibacteria bacterium]